MGTVHTHTKKKKSKRVVDMVKFLIRRHLFNYFWKESTVLALWKTKKLLVLGSTSVYRAAIIVGQLYIITIRTLL